MRTSIFLENIFISLFVLYIAKLGWINVSAINLGTIASTFKCYPDVQEGCDKPQEEAFTDQFWNNSIKRPRIRYYLFTNKNKETPELLHRCGGKLPPKTHFDPINRFIVIFGSYGTGMCITGRYREWKNRMLNTGEYNVMLVDNIEATLDDYTSAVAFNKIVAKQTAFVLQNIEAQTGILRSQLYFVGSALGAQLAGLIGGMCPGIGRITALDAAMPGYHEDVPLEERLDASDALLVDIMHCNMGPCLPQGGINYNAGHLDFYVGDGTHQPSCYPGLIDTLLKGDIFFFLGGLIPNSCDHDHCINYFTHSINPDDCQYVGVKCSSYEDFKSGKCKSCGSRGQNCAIMGFNLDQYLPLNRSSKCHKTYYVDTKLLCPYCDNSKIDLTGFKGTYESSLKH